jgi:hypothetical protein
MLALCEIFNEASNQHHSINSMEPETYLHFSPGYQIIICIPCKYAIKPDGIARHFKDQHSGQLDAKDRTTLVQYASMFTLIKPEEIQMPGLPCQRIIELKLRDGMKCNQCRFLCIGNESIKAHCRDKHSWNASKRNIWTECYVQSFFAGITSDKRLLI